MQPLSVLALLAVFAAMGGALLAVVSTARAVLWHYRSPPLRSSPVEHWLLIASVAAALLGSFWLAVAPYYSGFAGSVTISGAGTASVIAAPRSSSFLSVNGPGVLLLLALPVIVAFVPFSFRQCGTRPVAQALCAVVLASQAFFGMSGYGLFFAPSAALMLVAGILASSHHAA